MIYHNLGKLETSILKTLLKKPGLFIQKIAEQTRSDYKSVHTAVKRLEDKGYVEKAGTKLTLKGRLEHTWRLSQKGVAYLIATGQASLNDAAQNYFDKEILQAAFELAPLVGEQAFEKIVRKGFGLYLLALNDKQKILPKEALKYLVAAFAGWLFTYGQVELEPTVKANNRFTEIYKRLLQLKQKYLPP
jgi:predicted transcriptional regulator